MTNIESSSLLLEQSGSAQDIRATFKSMLLNLVSILMDCRTQLQIWHWNTQGNLHTDLGDAYEGLQAPVDGLAESYVESCEAQIVKRSCCKDFISEFSKPLMIHACDKVISLAKEVSAQPCSDEGINSYIGDVINTLRVLKFKQR